MDNYNYPMGADTPDAPWNQSDPDPVEVDVIASITLSKSTTVSVTDYNVEDWEDYDTGDEGEVIHIGGTDYDFSDTDFKGAFKEQEYTIPELLERLKTYITEDIENSGNNGRKIRELKRLLNACEGWTIDEEIVERE